MPRTTPIVRPLVRRPLLAATLATAAVLAGPTVGPAAAARHAPCPTSGRTLAKDVGPNLRVWREGAALKACSRVPGRGRHLRSLGRWSSATEVATGSGTVAWTTRTRTDDGLLVDAVSTVDVPSGRRWLRTAQAAVSPAAGTPASGDRVLRLITSYVGTGWVTARGVIALAVPEVDEEATAGAPPVVHRSGRRFFLGDAGPSEAAAVAEGLTFRVGGEHDDCGGDDVISLETPAFGGGDGTSFTFAVRPVTPDPDVC